MTDLINNTLTKLNNFNDKMNWSVEQLNKHTLLLKASKGNRSLRFTIAINELETRIDRLARDMASLLP